MLTKTSTVFYVILIAMLTSQLLWGADGRIEGKVTDATIGEPLFGANIFLEGTSIGAATNTDGKYLIANVPAGSYILKASYIGYETDTIKIQLKEGEHLEVNIKLEVVSVSTTEIVVTAQASGQNSAINQQLSSNNIVNVVSSTRIQELPDANAAESIGRLPGVSLVRDGGQATQVVIRGISPEYNQVTIAGVPVPSNESARQISSGDDEGGRFGGGRGVDMRMISSSSLAGIEVFKTNTPDMDASVLGGTVNLGIRKASKLVQVESPLGLSFLPGISFQAQGGYTDLTNEYNNYKFDLSLERRFLDERLGVFVQGIVQQQNFASDRLDANYDFIARSINPDSLMLTTLNLYFTPREEKRYNGTLTLDYNIPDGNIALMNIFSKSESNTRFFRQEYNITPGGNNIQYYVNESPSELNLITNILTYNQKLSLVDIDATLSHSYSENVSPDSWEIQFQQLSTGINQIDKELPPVKIAELAHQYVSMDDMEFRNVLTTNSFTRQRELRGSLNLSRNFNIADFLSLELKTGGMYSFTDRSYDYNRGFGFVTFGDIVNRIVQEYPWLRDYGIGEALSSRIFITPFLDPGLNVGTYLNGDYTFDNKLNLDYMRRIKEIVVDYGKNLPNSGTGGFSPWVPDMLWKVAGDYSGEEEKSAGYLMGTFHIGQIVSIMTGVRYQNLTTTYTGTQAYGASATNTFPQEFAHQDTTMTKTHGYWLPAINVKFNPLPWLSLRGAYTNTISYPNFRSIIPIIQVFSSGPRVTWNNVNLKPIQSENFDLQLSVYNNELGLFTFGGFLKYMDDFVFFEDSYINDPTKYEGLHNVARYPKLNVKGYRIRAYYNNPNQVELWGIESDWQTHFWYLPGVLSGLVLNVNYTHVFSKAKYPLTTVGNSGPPLFQPTYTNTIYTDRLINQPDDIVNVSLGWDYEGFSVLFSAIYQSAIFNNTHFYNSMRTDKAEYLRWDIAARQKLPWYNIEMFLNLNNLNGENDTYLVRGNNFQDTDESYGLTAQLGFRVNFN